MLSSVMIATSVAHTTTIVSFCRSCRAVTFTALPAAPSYK
jgi:hypothetical protein